MTKKRKTAGIWNTERDEEKKGLRRREKERKANERTRRGTQCEKREEERDGSEGVEERRWSPAFRINTSTASLGVPSGSLFASFPTLIPPSCFDVLPPRSLRSFSFLMSSSVPQYNLALTIVVFLVDLPILHSSPSFMSFLPRCFPSHCSPIAFFPLILTSFSSVLYVFLFIFLGYFFLRTRGSRKEMYVKFSQTV